MQQLVWNHCYTVGVRAMDDQHSILMDTLNELRLVLTRGHSHQQLTEKFDQLIEFMRMHFASEEQLLERIHYEALAEHRAAHHKLMADMLHAAHQMQHGEGVQVSAMLTLARESFLMHIEEFDRPYGPILNHSGVQ